MPDQFVTRMIIYDTIMRQMLVRHEVDMKPVSRGLTHWTPDYRVTPEQAKRLEKTK